jgi:hypothetical protein
MSKEIMATWLTLIPQATNNDYNNLFATAAAKGTATKSYPGYRVELSIDEGINCLFTIKPV